MASHSTGQHSSRGLDQGPEDAQLSRIDGEEDATDATLVAKMGGDAVDAYGTSLGEAASGVLRNVDIDEARQRLRDAQTALVALGYRIGEDDDPASGIDGIWGPETRDAIAAFQSDRGDKATGQLDGDTYEALLNAYEEALSTQAPTPLQDDFSPIHAEQPLSSGDMELLDPSLPDVADNSPAELLELHDELENSDDPREELTEVFDDSGESASERDLP